MAKKNRIAMKHDEDFELLDAELDAAMNRLDARNEQIEKLLESHSENGDGSQKDQDSGAEPRHPTQDSPSAEVFTE